MRRGEAGDSVAWPICVWLATDWLPCSVPLHYIHSALSPVIGYHWLQLGPGGRGSPPAKQILSTQGYHGHCSRTQFLFLSHT
jgi:hypothetical protein